MKIKPHFVNGFDTDAAATVSDATAAGSDASGAEVLLPL